MKDNFDIVSRSCFPEHYSNADGKFLSWLEKTFGIGTGRRKMCKDSGLSGAEKRACARQLKKSGWVKGQPMPASMAGIKPEDVPSGYVPPASYVPLPTEVYVAPYTQDTTYENTQTGISQPIPYDTPHTPKDTPPVPPKDASNALPDLDVPDIVWGMNPTQQIMAVFGGAALVTLTIVGVRKAIKNRNKLKLVTQ